MFPHIPEVIMVAIHLLWLPILLSAVAVFILSSIIHMFLGYHSSDFHKLPDEEATANALRTLGIPPGEYLLPHASSMAEMQSPEFIEKTKKGPRALLTLWAGGSISMTRELITWFFYTIVVSIFAAYIAGRALHPGAAYLAVFRFVGVTTFAGYVLAGWQDSIWYKRSWLTSIKNSFDGLIYAAVTAAIFGWLWPLSAM